MTLIPYKGTAPVMNDLLGGHVPVAFGVIPPALGNLAAGKLRAIARREPEAHRAAARHADLRGIRPARLRGRAALRSARARRHAEGRSSRS